GAPIMHDFCHISLSDLMTPWEVIEKRLRLAAEADFVICLYNPIHLWDRLENKLPRQLYILTYYQGYPYT
ncbi:hypothetical protein ACTPEF_26830, partial [Clostridioides difficile]